MGGIFFRIQTRTMSKKKPKNFEEAIARLENLTQAMQGGDMPLEESLAAYQEGVELVRFCQEKLAEAEQKLHILDENGTLKEFSLEDGE